MEGECGVGLRITETPPYRVRECVPGGPARQSGCIRPHDTLLAVDGVPVSCRPIHEVRAMISGNMGSTVQMRFMRPKSSTAAGARVLSLSGQHAVPSLDFSSAATSATSKFSSDSSAVDERHLYFDVTMVRRRVQAAGESPAKAAERHSWVRGQVLCKKLSPSDRVSASPDSDLDATRHNPPPPP
jgi:hypothetical protein